MTQTTTPATLHAWAIYLQASEEARRRGDRRTGTDHLLLALMQADPTTCSVLGASLIQARAALDALDADALGALGLTAPLDAPAHATRAVPAQPRLRDVIRGDRRQLTPAAKRVLESSVKGNRHKTHVTASQVLAQILRLQPPDPATALLDALKVDRAEALRQLVVVAPED